jgi:hypothetical protein
MMLHSLVLPNCCLLNQNEKCLPLYVGTLLYTSEQKQGRMEVPRYIFFHQ